VAPEQHLKVQIPSPADDRPRLARVGVVAAVGFVMGIVWPWLAGVRLVPGAPVEQGPVLAATSAPGPSASSAPPPATSLAPTGSAQAQAEPDSADRVKLGEASVTSCRDAQGKPLDECDTVDLASVVSARLRALGGCKGAESAHGMLSIGLELDFAKNRVERLLRGVSTTLPDGMTETLLGCARKEFATASLEGVQHAHPSYTVFYRVEFLPPGQRASDEESEAVEQPNEMTAASGMATVSWDVAIVREGPTQDSALQARLRSGTRVVVVGRRNDWYKVKYDAKGSEGWVYKSAIGL
jgi:hypothetical protein